MSRFTIDSTNATYQASDEGADYAGPEAALAVGIRGAIAILADEVNGGERNAAVEIGIASADGRQVLRFVVCLSVSPLMLRTEPVES